MILFELIAVELKKRSTKFAGSPEGQEKRGILLLSYIRAMLTFRAGFTHDGSRASHAVRRKSWMETQYPASYGESRLLCAHRTF